MKYDLNDLDADDLEEENFVKLKKDNLSLTAISDRVKSFIQRIGASYPKVNIDVTEHISSDILLPPAHAFHLYQVTKEAILNSLKHSSAKNIRVYFESEKQWKITIAGDGTGMSALNKKMGGGNGVVNMKNRSKEAGWNIHWLNGEESGTVVEISPTTN
jgi:signal transduction histidine kinase